MVENNSKTFEVPTGKKTPLNSIEQYVYFYLKSEDIFAETAVKFKENSKINIYSRMSQSAEENGGDTGIPSKEVNDSSFTLDGSVGRDYGQGYKTVHLSDIFDRKELEEISKSNLLMFGKISLKF